MAAPLPPGFMNCTKIFTYQSDLWLCEVHKFICQMTPGCINCTKFVQLMHPVVTRPRLAAPFVV